MGSRFSLSIFVFCASVVAGATSDPRGSNPPLPLVTCDCLLGCERLPPESLLRLISPYLLAELPDFGGYELLTTADVKAPRTLLLPPLRHDQSRWRPERLGPRNRPLYLFDVGFKHLEEDALILNTLVLSHVLNGEPGTLTFVAPPDRARALDQLNRFRLVMMDQTMRRYRARRPLPEPAEEVRRQTTLLRENSNADVLGVVTTDLPWSATKVQIRRALRTVVQVTYDRPKVFTGPSLDGLLAAASSSTTAGRALPFTLMTDARDPATAVFWKTHQEESVCELTWVDRGEGLGRPLVDRLYREVFARVRRRRCDVLVTMIESSAIRHVERYGFRKVRAVPAIDGPPKYLAALRVKSPEFVDVFGRLNREFPVE